MKNTNNKKGFTLIELLVVITIIGILATGATVVYTSQIQKARDTSRITDISVLKSGVEQIYQDKGSYPNTGTRTLSLPSFLEIKTYIPKINADPKTGQKSANSNYDYTYAVANDSNGLKGQIYELSTALENAGNITSKAGKDGGTDGYRLEQGISSVSLGTAINNNTPATSWINATIIGNACIARVPGVSAPAVGTASAIPGVCNTTETTNTNNLQTLIIR